MRALHSLAPLLIGNRVELVTEIALINSVLQMLSSVLESPRKRASHSHRASSQHDLVHMRDGWRVALAGGDLGENRPQI